MKCMKCGIPIDDSSFYCTSCRSEFYWPARTSEQEEKNPEDDIGNVLVDLATPPGQDGVAELKQMISYLRLKRKVVQMREKQTSETSGIDPTDLE